MELEYLFSLSDAYFKLLIMQNVKIKSKLSIDFTKAVSVANVRIHFMADTS